MEQFAAKQKKDLKVLITFVGVYCAAQHDRREEFPLPAELAGMVRPVTLCPECRRFLEYALDKRRKCPLDPKPTCKHCHIHCYSKEYREQIRRIMAFSGRKMIMRGRLDYLWHYFF